MGGGYTKQHKTSSINMSWWVTFLACNHGPSMPALSNTKQHDGSTMMKDVRMIVMWLVWCENPLAVC
jgi:hypothetical protein